MEFNANKVRELIGAAVEDLAHLMRYASEENYMDDDHARHTAIEGLHSLTKALGEMDRLF